MIEFAKSYRVGPKVFATLEEAQAASLLEIFEHILIGDAKATINAQHLNPLIAEVLIKERERVIDILSTTASSKPRARKINGGRKKRQSCVGEPATPPK